MDPRKLGIDDRLRRWCTYCGGAPGTRDHAPSKVFVEESLITGDLPVVDACFDCNNGFSLDEEYVACFLEAVVCGSTNSHEVGRPKVRDVLVAKPYFAKIIQESAIHNENGTLTWIPDKNRIERILVKLARSHIAYELNLLVLNEPDQLEYLPLISMEKSFRDEFEKAGSCEIRPWPEIGSRAFLRSIGATPYHQQSGPWIIVQDQRYRYTVDQYGGVAVQIVLSEYLGCVVNWFE